MIFLETSLYFRECNCDTYHMLLLEIVSQWYWKFRELKDIHMFAEREEERSEQ